MTGAPGAPSGARWRRVLAEPALHFVLAGAVIFGADAWRRARQRPRVTVEAAEVQALREIVRGRTNREPTREELAGAVQARVDEALLVDEALRRGLDRADPAVRARLADRMRAVIRSEQAGRDPTRAELEAHLRAHAGRYQRPARVELDEVDVAPASPHWTDSVEADRAALQRDLDAGWDPRAPSDAGIAVFLRRLPRARRTEAELVTRRDGTYAAAVFALTDARWHALATSYGHTLVRVHRSLPAGVMTVDEAQPGIADDWRGAQADAALASALAALRARAEVVVSWPDAR